VGAVEWRHGAPLPVARPRTLPELIVAARARAGTATVLVDGGLAVTWPDLDAWSGRLAATWAARVAPGERIAIIAPNGLAHLLAELAAWRLGAVAVPLCAGFGAARLAALLALVAPRLLLLSAAPLAGIPEGIAVLTPAEVQAAARSPGPGCERAVQPDDPCLIQFTSGSTGSPRGVVLSHDNLCSQQAAFALLWPAVGPGDRLAAYLPWHHSFGGLAERLWALARGARITVVPGGGRDHDALLATIKAVRPTVFMSVPKVHDLAIAAEAFAPGDLRWAFTAGAPLAPGLAAWYAARGIPLLEGWGLTEASPSCTITPLGGPHGAGVVGQPIPGVAVGVRRADGRILVRGPGVMRGYFRQESPCLAGGVLDSGDLGAWVPQGLRLTGRADHQLKLPNGEKVCAAALERALLAQPGIAHAVVGVARDLVAVLDCPAGPATARAALVAVNAARTIPYERIATAVLLRQRPSVENGLLTPSLKIARGRMLAALDQPAEVERI
jgi:long-subunit acyl-CoA synthetase (AMP-forming)